MEVTVVPAVMAKVTAAPSATGKILGWAVLVVLDVWVGVGVLE